MEKNNAKTTEQQSFLQETIKTVKTQGFPTIQHFLKDSFNGLELKTAQQQQPAFTTVNSFLQNLMGQSQPQLAQTQKVDISQFLNLFNSLLYGNADHRKVVKQLASGFKSMGVCAKPLKAGDVAWKCEDCEKDPTCIICQECFDKGDHKGHRVWLKTNVGGCCDCGDPDGWDEKGFCSNHKGFAASTENMLKSLPPYLKEAAPYCFKELSSLLKDNLLKVQTTADNKVLKLVTEELLNLMVQSCADLPSNIYFLSQALTEIFYGDHLKPADHTCNYRYFISWQHEETFKNQKEQLKQHQDTLCSCSTLDLLFQTNLKFDPKFQKKLNELCITLFQTYEFKQHLAMAYVANLKDISFWKDSDKSLQHLGVQVLTIEAITEQIMSDPLLRGQFKTVLDQLITNIIQDPQDNAKLYQILTFIHDIKYMGKADVLPMIIQQTDFIQELIVSLKKFHYSDCSKRPTEMELFDTATAKQLVSLTAQMEISSKVQIYLDRILQPADIFKFLQFFEKILSEVFEDLQNYQYQSFFMMPVVRLFSYFVQRLNLKELIEGNVYEISNQLAKSAVTLLAIQNGFMSELKSKLWIYKGEIFQRLSLVYTEGFIEYFLSDLGLIQILILKIPSYFDVYLKAFGTNPLFTPLFISIVNSLNDDDDIATQTESFNKTIKPWLEQIDPEKIGLLIQNLLTRVVHICIFETSLTANHRHLFQPESQEMEEFDQIFSQQVKREVFHVLFMLGASTTIEKIKKHTSKIFVNHKSFMPSLLSLTTSSADNQGKIAFRLKDEYLPMYDPYYYISETEQNLQNAAYAYHRQNENLNNIVGDYLQNYKYSTGANKTIWKIISRSKFAKVIILVVREYLTGSEAVKLKVINQQAFNAALKLLVIVLQSLEESDTLKQFIRLQFPKTLLTEFVKDTSHDDKKLKAILLYISKTLHTDQAEDEQMQSDNQSSVNNQQEKQSSIFKDAIKKKKAELLAKMKAKQQNFLSNTQPAKDTPDTQDKPMIQEESKEVQPEESKTELTCAACQEPLTLKSYDQRMYVQLGYVSRSKLLLHSYSQTSKQQLKSYQDYKQSQKSEQKKEQNVLTLDELRVLEDQTVFEFGLDGVIDAETKCGSQFNRCCHYFHFDCLAQYKTAEANKSYQQAYVRNMIGLDDDMIQCPICKTLSNTFQPILPITSSSMMVGNHIQFLSDLIKKPSRKSKETLLIDIINEPLVFIQDVMQLLVHSILTLTTYRQKNMLTLFDSQTTSHDFTLRDLVYIYMSTVNIVKFSQEQTKQYTMSELTEELMLKFSNESFTQSPLKRNHAKLVIQMIFMNGLIGNQKEIFSVFLQSIYSVFKAQIAAAYFFQQESGLADSKDLQDEWPTKILGFFDEKQQLSTEPDQNKNDKVIDMQLQFLRAATCMKLIVDAAAKEQLDDQLGLDVGFIKLLKSQTENKVEYELLLEFLGLDKNNQEVYQEPKDLLTLLEQGKISENIYYSVQNLTSLNSDLITQLVLIGQQPRPHLQQKQEFSYSSNVQETVEIPRAMSVLTPYFTLQFVDLPNDYQTLVKDYYAKQCRNCKKQLQKNAMCLLCGEILCLQTNPEQMCCRQLPGMLKESTLNVAQGTSKTTNKEGELSYHARHWEGGNSAFIIPSTGEIFLIDDGRACSFDSFYRNQLGEVFSQQLTKKWENFYIKEETGGEKVLQILRKLVIQGEIPNYVIQERQKKSSVFRRNVF